ncbi:hypothetical protein [Flagellimonas flava]|uniref:hypothetical protein n=1 Tax=Flagellimonas flava TaxID=570519 RepID=UPI003D64B079
MKSTNEHGVHSPFVFRFVTQCLYSKGKAHKSKSIDVLLKCIFYFDVSKVAILDHLQAAQTIMNSFPHLEYDKQSSDVVFANQFDLFHFNQLLTEGKLHNDSVVLIDGIHQNPQKQEQWQSLITSPKITVSIDMYHLGAIFIRSEQEKEHFTIRI